MQYKNTTCPKVSTSCYFHVRSLSNAKVGFNYFIFSRFHSDLPFPADISKQSETFVMYFFLLVWFTPRPIADYGRLQLLLKRSPPSFCRCRSMMMLSNTESAIHRNDCHRHQTTRVTLAFCRLWLKRTPRWLKT